MNDKKTRPFNQLISSTQVLLAIQDKLNNPKADDPFEPDIAQVSRIMSDYLLYLTRLRKASEGEPNAIQCYC